MGCAAAVDGDGRMCKMSAQMRLKWRIILPAPTASRLSNFQTGGRLRDVIKVLTHDIQPMGGVRASLAAAEGMARAQAIVIVPRTHAIFFILREINYWVISRFAK